MDGHAGRGNAPGEMPGVTPGENPGEIPGETPGEIPGDYRSPCSRGSYLDVGVTSSQYGLSHPLSKNRRSRSAIR